MFSRLSTMFLCVLSTFTLLAVATPNPYMRRGGEPTTAPPITKTVTVTAPAPTATNASQCNTGSLQCCDSVQSANSASASAILGLLGVVLTDPTALVGLTCSPLSVIGVGTGNSCSARPVCCTNNSFGGLISIGCIPVSI